MTSRPMPPRQAADARAATPDPAAIAVPTAFASFRRFPLDDALLLFDRATGLNVLCDGPETIGLRQRAPRSIQFAITNRCNLACAFCSRPVEAPSTWTAETAFTLLAGLASHGVLEVAFGGGEPFAFPGFPALLRRLWDETPLAASVTTNGLLLDAGTLASLRGRIGELRVSLYDTNRWRETIASLAEHRIRYGVNWLVTPESLPQLEDRLLELASLGCRDALLLAYKGGDRSLHLATAQVEDLAQRLRRLHRALGDRLQLKLDICWGERLAGVPQLMRSGDCGAGRDFLVITSDGSVSPCSFHDGRHRAGSADDVLEVWRSARTPLASAARRPGCARLAGYGL